MTEKEMQMIVGNNIKNLRETKKKSKASLVKEIEYDRQDLKNLEDGAQDIKLNTLIAIAKNLDVDLTLLFSRDFRTERVTPYVDDDFMMVFSNNTYRIIHNSPDKTEADMAEKIGVDATTISRILTHQIQYPRLSTLFYISEYLEVSLEIMFRRQGGII